MIYLNNMRREKWRIIFLPKIIAIVILLIIGISLNGWADSEASSGVEMKVRGLAKSANELYKKGQTEEAFQLVNEVLKLAYVPNILLLKCELHIRLHAVEEGRRCLDDFEHREPSLDPSQRDKTRELRRGLVPAFSLVSVPPPMPQESRARLSSTAPAPAWRHGWFWGVMATGAAALTLGLSLGLTPRPYESVTWAR